MYAHKTKADPHRTRSPIPIQEIRTSECSLSFITTYASIKNCVPAECQTAKRTPVFKVSASSSNNISSNVIKAPQTTETKSLAAVQQNSGNMDMDAANALMALYYGTCSTTCNDLTIGRSDVQHISQDNGLSVDQLRISRICEERNQIAIDSRNGVREGHQEELYHSSGGLLGTKTALVWNPGCSSTWEMYWTGFRSAVALDAQNHIAHKGPAISGSTRKFASKRILGAHQRHRHSGLNIRRSHNKKSAIRTPHQCTKCGFSSKHTFSLKRHYTRLHTDRAPQFSCKYACGYLSKSKWNRSRHEKSCSKASGHK